MYCTYPPPPPPFLAFPRVFLLPCVLGLMLGLLSVRLVACLMHAWLVALLVAWCVVGLLLGLAWLGLILGLQPRNSLGNAMWTEEERNDPTTAAAARQGDGAPAQAESKASSSGVRCVLGGVSRLRRRRASEGRRGCDGLLFFVLVFGAGSVRLETFLMATQICQLRPCCGHAFRRFLVTVTCVRAV